MDQHFPPTVETPLRRPIVVWDLPTRIFKWSLVVAVGLAFLFSSSHPHGSLFLVHVACGYVVTLLLLFRLAWGSSADDMPGFAPSSMVGGMSGSMRKGYCASIHRELSGITRSVAG